MVLDGTFDRIINQELFGQLNEEITEISNNLDNKIDKKDFKIIVPSST